MKNPADPACLDGDAAVESGVDSGGDAADDSAIDSTADADDGAADSTSTDSMPTDSMSTDSMTTDSMTADSTTVDTGADAGPDTADACTANACGGCTTLTHAPLSICGACMTGVYKCASSKEATYCDDPVTVAPGTKCGVCGTSTYACAGLTTACSKDDDRTDGTDAFHTAVGPFDSLDPTHIYAIAFKMPRLGSIKSFTIFGNRYNSSGTNAGALRLRLVTGAPSSPSPALASIVSTVSLPGDSVPDIPSSIVVTLPSPTPNIPAGTALYIEIVDSSDKYDFSIGGTSSTAVTFWSAGPTDSAFSTLDASWGRPYLDLAVRGCY